MCRIAKDCAKRDLARFSDSSFVALSNLTTAFPFRSFPFKALFLSVRRDNATGRAASLNLDSADPGVRRIVSARMRVFGRGHAEPTNPASKERNGAYAKSNRMTSLGTVARTDRLVTFIIARPSPSSSVWPCTSSFPVTTCSQP